MSVRSTRSTKDGRVSVRAKVPDPPTYTRQRRPISATLPIRAEWSIDSVEELNWKAALMPRAVVHPSEHSDAHWLQHTRRRDLLVSHARRVEEAANSGSVSREEAAIARSVVRSQLKTRRELRQEAEMSRRAASEAFVQDPGPGPRPRPSSASGFLSRRPRSAAEEEMSRLWLQRRRAKIAKARNDASMKQALSDWTERRARLEEDMARRAEARRRPLSAAAAAGAVRLASGVAEALEKRDENANANVVNDRKTTSRKDAQKPREKSWVPGNQGVFVEEEDSMLQAEASIWERGRGAENSKGEEEEEEEEYFEEGDGEEDGDGDDPLEREIERMREERRQQMIVQEAGKSLSGARGGGRPWSAVSAATDATTATGARPASAVRKRLPVPVAVQRSTAPNGYMHFSNPIADPSKAAPRLPQVLSGGALSRGRDEAPQNISSGGRDVPPQNISSGGGDVPPPVPHPTTRSLPKQLGQEMEETKQDLPQLLAPGEVVDEGDEMAAEERRQKQKIAAEQARRKEWLQNRQVPSYISTETQSEMDKIRQAFLRKGLGHLLPSSTKLERALVPVGTKEEQDRNRAAAIATAVPPTSIRAAPPDVPPPMPLPPSQTVKPIKDTKKKTSKDTGRSSKSKKSTTSKKQPNLPSQPSTIAPPIPPPKPPPSYGADTVGIVRAASRQTLDAVGPSSLLESALLPPDPYRNEWLRLHTKSKKKKGKKKSKKS